MAEACPFCALDTDRILWSDENAVLVYDAFPVSPGHMLAIPKRHIASFFEASPAEHQSLLAALTEARGLAEHKIEPDGFNIGINDGEAAGQTVPHLHVHLIPRFQGDAEDPRGGVRWVRAEAARYW